uniref:Uncharacterized protein n=1 Tax=Anguilla anguilla TaxID=7936 RepID=A0A0E9SXR0_ANGAN
MITDCGSPEGERERERTSE